MSPSLTRRPHHSPFTRVRIVAGGCAAMALGMGVVSGWGHPAFWALPLLGAAVAMAEIAVVHLVFGRQRWTMSLSEATIAAALMLSPGAWIVIAVSVGVLAAQLVRRQSVLKLQFNVAQIAASSAVAVYLAGMVGNVGGAVAGMGAYTVLNCMLVAAAVSLTTGRSLLRLMWQSAPFSAIHSTGTASIGLLAGWLAVNAPVGLLGLVVPLVLLWLSYDEQTLRAAEAQMYAELARGQQRSGERSVDVSAQVVSSAATRLFGEAEVEMVLLGADGPARYVAGDTGVTRRRVDPDAFNAPWVLDLLGARGVRTGIVGGRPYCSALIGEPDAPLGAFVVRRCAGQEPFGRREVVLTRVLARQAESWLSVAELARSRDEALAQAEAAEDAARALGDLGAHTAPALGVLRESSARLTRLASAPDGPDPIGDIVDQLRTVERAVASLLGAVALAAEPELSRGAGLIGDTGLAGNDMPSPADADEWTTTGTLASA